MDGASSGEGTDEEETGVEHLVFLGAGALWPSYCGVVEELVRRRRLRRLRTVVGVSAGSLSIVLLVIAFTRPAAEAAAKFRYLSRVMDTRHTMFASGGPDPVEQVVEFGYGLHTAVHFCHFVRNELSEAIGNPDATLSEVDRLCGVRYRVLVYEADSHALRGARPLVLDAESHPDLPVWVAVRASSSVFPVISPVRVRGGASWWLDPAVFDRYEVWARSLVEDLPGQYLVVEANGLRTMNLSQLRRGIWGFSELEVLLLWAIAAWRGVRPGGFETLRGDPRVLRVDVQSFPLNLGMNAVSNTEMHRAGARACRRYLRRLELTLPLRGPAECFSLGFSGTVGGR